MDIETFQQQAAEAAGLLKMLANESRLMVLCHLVANNELTVGELNARVPLSQSALSQHLAKLREEGVLTTRKEAQTVYYRIADTRAHQMMGLLHDLFCPDLDTNPPLATGVPQ